MGEPSAAVRRGRAARRAARAEDKVRAVWPGVEGGRFLPLTPPDVAQVREAVFDLLSEIGLANPIPSMIELVTGRGGAMTGDGRLLFPRGLVEDVIAGCRKDIVLHGQRPGLELALSGARVFVGSGGASPNMVDLETGRYREAMLADLYDAACLVDRLDNIHFFNRSLVARDVTDPRLFDLNTAYASLAGTAKHIGLSFASPAHVQEAAALFDEVAGGPGRFRERPFCTLLACHVVPPLRFAEEACAVLETGVRLGFPVQLISAGQAGATSPAPLAGSVVQAVAESLAGLVFIYLVDPSVQAIFAPKPLVSDLRSGAMSGGSGEQAVLMAAAAQMGRHFGLITSSMAGMTDAKIPDAQHGYEKCAGLALAAHAGANVVTQGCGLQASLTGCALESYVVDNDMIGQVLRTVRGIEVDDETLSRDVIAEVVRGEGHYLGHGQTLARMQSDYLYPDVGDRATAAEWEAAGALDIRERARSRAREILRGPRPDHLPPAIDARLRARFDILLPPGSAT